MKRFRGCSGKQRNQHSKHNHKRHQHNKHNHSNSGIPLTGGHIRDSRHNYNHKATFIKKHQSKQCKERLIVGISYGNKKHPQKPQGTQPPSRKRKMTSVNTGITITALIIEIEGGNFDNYIRFDLDIL